MEQEHWYQGTVNHGLHNGTGFGFPTANVRLTEPANIAKGVYAARVKVQDEIYKAMLYVGTRPTLDLNEFIYEINILHFNRNIYGETIAFQIVQKIRDEQKFPSIEALIRQLTADRETVDSMLTE